MSVSTTDAVKTGPRLRWEIGLALLFKIVVLGLLWFWFFRHDPAVPKPAVADLFAPASPSIPIKGAQP